MARFERTFTVGGLPGTGTTTACRNLGEATGLPYVYAGRIFRERAEELRMTLEQFGTYCETHPEEDRALDQRQVDLLRGKPLILEGRLSGILAAREKVPAFKVWFTCDPWERAARIVKREGGETEERMAEMRRREESEKKRYLEFYGYDLSDLSVYDLVLDTTDLSPEQVLERILASYEAGMRPAKKWYQVWRRAA